MMSSAPAAPVGMQELESSLAESWGMPCRIASRTDFGGATSHPLWKIDASVGGRRTVVILKELTPGLELPAASRTRPSFITNPDREGWIYRSRVGGSGITPRFVAASPPGHERSWIAVEFVAGAELWQMADLAAWQSAAEALADLHHRVGPAALGETTTATPLVRHNRAFYERWWERAMAFAEPVHRAAVHELVAIGRSTLDLVLDQPRTLIHGESFASNILVRSDRTCALIDWETAAEGPGLWDVASLVAGWDEPVVQQLAAAYRLRATGAGDDGLGADCLLRSLDACRLQQCLQWIGWAPQWTPPEEHRQDWVAIGLRLAERLRS